MTLYFDLTDVIDFASRYSRVTGIQRVQMNIVTHLARKHGGGKVRCTYFDSKRHAMLEFDPAQLSANREFDAEALLADLGITTQVTWLGGLSKSQIKSYLRRYNHRKVVRALKKMEIYLSAALFPSHLHAMGLSVARSRQSTGVAVRLANIDELPSGDAYVCMGSIWKYPEVLAFAKRQHAAGSKVVQMVYDLIPIVHPEYYSPAEPREYADWLQDAFEYVDRFICISKWTEADLHRYAARTNRKINTYVAPLAHEFYGFERAARAPTPTEAASLDDRPFVLCVGTIETRKNIPILLDAWRQLASELGDAMPTLVLAGKYGKGGDRVQRMLGEHPFLQRLVRLEHAPSDSQLAWLYGNCLFTVFPSTYEGWGLPVGESAWFGKYCIASRATSIPEVCGDLLDYIDPTDVEGLKQEIKKLVVNTELLRTHETKIGAATLRTWASVADDVYDNAATEANSSSKGF